MSEIDRVQIDIGLDQIILLAVGANFYRWATEYSLFSPGRLPRLWFPGCEVYSSDYPKLVHLDIDRSIYMLAVGTACVLLGGRFAPVVVIFATQLQVYAMQLYGQFTGSYVKAPGFDRDLRRACEALAAAAGLLAPQALYLGFNADGLGLTVPSSMPVFGVPLACVALFVYHCRQYSTNARAEAEASLASSAAPDEQLMSGSSEFVPAPRGEFVPAPRGTNGRAGAEARPPAGKFEAGFYSDEPEFVPAPRVPKDEKVSAERGAGAEPSPASRPPKPPKPAPRPKPVAMPREFPSAPSFPDALPEWLAAVWYNGNSPRPEPLRGLLPQLEVLLSPHRIRSFFQPFRSVVDQARTPYDPYGFQRVPLGP